MDNMEQNEKEIAFEAGRNWQKGHNTPSPETLKMVGKLQVELAESKQFMKDLKESNEREHAEIKEMITSVVSKLDKALDGKANKWTEDVIRWLLYIIATGVIGIVGGLVIQAIVHFNAK